MKVMDIVNDYLVRSQASDNNHLLEVRQMLRPWSRKRSSMRFFTIVDLTPLMRVTHKTFPAKFYIPKVNMLGKSVCRASYDVHEVRTRLRGTFLQVMISVRVINRNSQHSSNSKIFISFKAILKLESVLCS